MDVPLAVSSFLDVTADPIGVGRHTRKHGRAIRAAAGNLRPAGKSVYRPGLQRAADAGERTTRVAGARSAATGNVSGADHVVGQQVVVPGRLVAHRPVEQCQLDLMQRTRC